MKKLLALLMFAAAVFSLAATAATAADPAITPDGLPPLVFFLSEGGDLSTSGQHGLFGVTRGGAEATVVFRSREALDAFLHTLPPAQAATLSPMQVPGSTVASLVDQGGSALVDPVSLTEGGATVLKNAAAPATDNVDLARMYREDQADRLPAGGKPIDWKIVSPRDADRRAAVMALFKSGALATGPDFFHAATIMHHGENADDYLLAHDLCIVALSKGVPDAKWLVAASEDRFLIAIGRKQRFGTQLGLPLETDGALTDGFRHALNVPKLTESIEQSRALGGH